MNDFDFEIKERKSLARNARCKKNGSKSKMCRLPSDGMTRSEWKRRCGEVISYNLGKPMTWKEFKGLPSDIQKEYVVRLRSKYNASYNDMCSLFGVKHSTLSMYFLNHNINTELPYGAKMGGAASSPETIKLWNAFICGDASESEVYTPYVIDPVPVEPVPEPVIDTPEKENEPEVKEEKSRSNSMSEFSITFSGELNISDIANSLSLILGKTASGVINIVYCSKI